MKNVSLNEQMHEAFACPTPGNTSNPEAKNSFGFDCQVRQIPVLEEALEVGGVAVGERDRENGLALWFSMRENSTLRLKATLACNKKAPPFPAEPFLQQRQTLLLVVE